jgi:uncharacterized protein YcgL (UPF0745 family)
MPLNRHKKFNYRSHVLHLDGEEEFKSVPERNESFLGCASLFLVLNVAQRRPTTKAEK